MFPLLFILLLLVPQKLLGDEIYKYHRQNMFYEELKKLKASCYPSDTCALERSFDAPEIQHGYSCSCDSQCSVFGTCCIDSPYRLNSKLTLKCRPAEVPYYFYDYGRYMVDRCPESVESYSVWKHFCEKEWDEEGDILKLIPVASLNTNTTYKNFYCFRCHEETENFLYWAVHLKGYVDTPDFDRGKMYLSLTYNKDKKMWVVTFGEDFISLPVELEFFDTNIPFSTKFCDLRVISDCSDSWTDNYIRDKCSAYTAITYVDKGTMTTLLEGKVKRLGTDVLTYKNVHCALCNYEPLSDIICALHPDWTTISRDPVIFRHTVDYNFPKKKNTECVAPDSWDPVGKQCKKRKICVISGYVIRDGKCVPP